MIFRTNDKEYRASSAKEIACAIERDASDYPHRGQPIRTFLDWSLKQLSEHIPPREMESSDRIADEELALNYLYLRDEYGAGQLSTNRNREMRLLIAYDASSYAETAIEDLERAGLPKSVEILVASVADFSSRRLPLSEFDLVSAASKRIDRVLRRGERHRQRVEQDTAEMANRAASEIRNQYPEWRVGTEILRGDPVYALLQIAASFEADLIVVGSQGRSAIGRFFLGSVSKSLAENAKVPVRVVRGSRKENADEPIEIVLGPKTPDEASRLVEVVAGREWPPKTKVHVVAIDDRVSPDRVSAFYSYGKSIYESAVEPLVAAGLDVSVRIERGHPTTILNWAAFQSRADAIFVVAGSGVDGVGSDATSLGLITSAKCTVELIR